MLRQVNGHQNNTDRDEYDFYPTDPAWVKVLLRHVTFEGLVTEPCAGDGAMVKPLIDAGYIVEASDIRPMAPGIIERNALEIDPAQNIVTNPPYGEMRPLIDHWLATTEGKVALLVRINFLEAQSRVPLLTGSNTPEKVIVVAGRMKVFGKVSQFPHIWVVWDRAAATKHTQLIIDKQ